MDAIKSWVMTICFAAVAAGMAGILCPSGSLEKIYKFVVALFFLACVLVPAFSLGKVPFTNPVQAVLQTGADSDMQTVLSEQETEASREKIGELVKACCENFGAEPVSVRVDFGAAGSSGTAVQCTVALSAKDMGKKSEIASMIRTQLGFGAQIVAAQAAGEG